MDEAEKFAVLLDKRFEAIESAIIDLSVVAVHLASFRPARTDKQELEFIEAVGSLVNIKDRLCP